jgi:hypothetical protein
MESPKIQAVKPMDGLRLLVRFTNGVEKIYHCASLLRLAPFRALTNAVFFRQVKVDAGGYGVSWSDDVDLSEYELWTNGQEWAPAR